jgi:hypothetical protein
LVLEGLEGDLEETLETSFGLGGGAASEEDVQSAARPHREEVSVPEPETCRETGTRDWFEVADLHPAILPHFATVERKFCNSVRCCRT